MTEHHAKLIKAASLCKWDRKNSCEGERNSSGSAGAMDTSITTLPLIELEAEEIC